MCELKYCDAQAHVLNIFIPIVVNVLSYVHSACYWYVGNKVLAEWFTFDTVSCHGRASIPGRVSLVDDGFSTFLKTQVQLNMAWISKLQNNNTRLKQ